MREELLRKCSGDKTLVLMRKIPNGIHNQVQNGWGHESSENSLGNCWGHLFQSSALVFWVTSNMAGQKDTFPSNVVNTI